MQSVRIMFATAALWMMPGARSTIAQPTGVRAFEVIDVGVVPGESVSGVQGLDDFARVAGESGRVFPIPFAWIDGELLLIPAPSGYERPRVTDIGSGPVVSGRATRSGSPDWHPVLWTATQGIFILNLVPGTTVGSARSVDDRRWPLASSAGVCNAGVDYATTWRGLSARQVGGPRSSA